MVFPASVKGVVGIRVSDAEPFYATELETHNTPQYMAFYMIAGALSPDASGNWQLGTIAIVSSSGVTMGIAGFQTTSVTTPGYIYTWGLTSTTGLAGISGTAYGIYFVTNIQSTVAGTVASVMLFYNGSTNPAFIGAPASQVPVVAGQFIQVSVAIFAGLTNWSGTISALGVSVVSVSVNQGFLQGIAFIYIPRAIGWANMDVYENFISTLVIGSGAFALNPSNNGMPTYSLASNPPSVTLTWWAWITPASNLSAGTITWTGYASPYVIWNGTTTTYTQYVTVQAVLSSAVTFPAGVTHFFTLIASFTQ